LIKSINNNKKNDLAFQSSDQKECFNIALIKEKLNELNNLLDAYKESPKIKFEEFSNSETNKSLFLIHADLFFSSKHLKKLNVHYLIFKGKLSVHPWGNNLKKILHQPPVRWSDFWEFQ